MWKNEMVLYSLCVENKKGALYNVKYTFVNIWNGSLCIIFFHNNVRFIFVYLSSK